MTLFASCLLPKTLAGDTMKERGWVVMGTSVWPNDIYNTPRPTLDKKSLGSVRCFLACPFGPKERWDDLLSLVKDVCAMVGQSIGINFECFRADSITSSGVIHPEIWEALRSSDMIVVDVSGQNGNVLLELGTCKWGQVLKYQL